MKSRPGDENVNIHNLPMDGGIEKVSGGRRRANKPLMERRRRARINTSLTELKSLVLEGMKKDPNRYSRLEKADILEMTVDHLKAVQKQQTNELDPDTLLRYKTGFAECATEIGRYLNQLEGLDTNIKRNIAAHLSSCMERLSSEEGKLSDSTKECSARLAPEEEPPSNKVSDGGSRDQEGGRRPDSGSSATDHHLRASGECSTNSKHGGLASTASVRRFTRTTEEVRLQPGLNSVRTKGIQAVSNSLLAAAIQRQSQENANNNNNKDSNNNNNNISSEHAANKATVTKDSELIQTVVPVIISREMVAPIFITPQVAAPESMANSSRRAAPADANSGDLKPSSDMWRPW